MRLLTITMLAAAVAPGPQALVRRAEARPAAPVEQAAVPVAQAFDIAGLRIGQDEASALAALHAQGYSTRLVTSGYQQPDEPPRTLRIGAVKRDPTAPVTDDSVVVWLSYPPDSARVVGIHRSLQYARENAPTLNSFMGAAKAKAGFEVSRRQPNVYVGTYEGEQLIRWRPDGKRISGLGKLLSNLPKSGQRDPCVDPFAVPSGYASPVEELDHVRMFATDYYPDRAKRDPMFGMYEGFFVPSPNCGTTFTSFIRQDRQGFAQHVRLLLADQAAMHRSAAAFHRWWRERAAESWRRRNTEAAKPDI